jgi:hypothetical protein
MNFYRFYTHHHVLEPSFSRISTTLQTTKFERQKAWPATRHSIGQDRSIFLAVSHQATTSPLGGSAEVRTAMSVISDAEARNLWRNGRAKRSDLDEQHQLRQVGEKIEVEDGAWHEQGAGGVSKQLYNIAVRAGSPTVPNLRPLSPSSIMLDENQVPTSMEGYTQLATTPLHPSVAALQGRDRNQPHAALSTPTQPTRTAGERPAPSPSPDPRRPRRPRR